MTRDEALIELARHEARTNYLSFVNWTWRRTEPLIIGAHTQSIADVLTLAVDRFLDGQSTYLIIKVPFRHGKSDLVSRYFPPYVLGRTWERKMSIDGVVASYSAKLAESFSKFGQAVIRSQAYQELFPGTMIEKGRSAVGAWGLNGSVGEFIFVGLDGSITGKGGNIIIVDDYCKNRQDAYSETMRNKIWEQFRVDIMSRRQEPCICIVCATPWHPDDLLGRIRQEQEKEPDFPKFEEIVYPARKTNEYEYLFPERYTPEWYKSQRATLGAEMAAALLDCNPVGEGNRVFRPEWIHETTNPPSQDAMNVILLVDSANSKRTQRDAADYTSMQVWGLGRDRNYYLLDARRERLNLKERTTRLFDLVEKWHPQMVFWEQIGAMSDVQHVQLEQDRLAYHFPITPLPQKVSKMDRIQWLVPLYEAGRIWIPPRIMKLDAEGNTYDFIDKFLKNEYATFPVSRHDDMLDCMANLMHPVVVSSVRFPESVSAYGDAPVKTTASQWRPANW